MGQIRIKLESPDGSEYVLSSFVGGTGNNYTNTIFHDTSSIMISNASAPFSGIFHPVDNLALFNNGQNPNGTWNLNIRDAVSGTIGTVVSWSLTFSSSPAGSFNFTDSDLPIVVVNTNGQTIQNNIEIPGMMGIIYNGPGIRNYMTDPFNYYNQPISIEVRGQSSAGFPQKQYHVETKDSLGLNYDVSLFGMPIENDWILYAPYNDKSLMRNVLTYKIARDMGHWAARTRFCEVVLNGSYNGIYVFMEKIKRDNGRVDIKKLLSNYTYGDFVTGGYIFSIDKDPADWTSNIPPNNSNAGQTIGFHYVYPDPDSIQ
ncbi:MAG: CotH kinase family protein, partial [Bacteroidota bacterium]